MKKSTGGRAAAKKTVARKTPGHVHQDTGRLHVRFVLAGEKYAIPIDSIQEIIKPQNLTEIPHTPDYLCGVVNLRGKIVPVVDLRLRLGLPSREIMKKTRIIVVRGLDQFIGLLVDEVAEVRPIPAAGIEKPSPVLSGPVDASFFNGIANLDEDIVAILDLDRVLQKPGKNIAARALLGQAEQ